MARGGARLGAGRPRKSVAALVRAGTYRPDRHGALPANVLAMPAPEAVPWQPTPDDLAVIGPAGLDLIARMLQGYTFSVAEGVLLLEAGQASAALSAVRSVDRAGSTLREQATLDRMEQGWMRLLAGLLAQLKVTTA